MFYGYSKHTLDKKNRFFVPSKILKKYKRNKKFMLTAGLEKCLFLFTEDDWEKINQKIDTLPSIGKKDVRTFKRIFYSQANEVEIDAQKRILIPSMSLEYAGIKNEIVIIGVLDRTEIWSPERWEKYKKDSYNVYADVAEELGV